MIISSTPNILPATQLKNLNELGYPEMTPVQAAALPAILAGKGACVQAKTGSGKTAAFGLGLLQHVDAALFQTQSLVLCPTHELADQVTGELRRLARFLPDTKILTLCGRQPFDAQRDSLQHAPHIIAATLGHLLDHLQKSTVSLDTLNTLVMDETDRMLGMGSSNAINDAIRFASASRQTLLLSATWSEVTAVISGRVQQNPLTIEIDTADALPATEQQFFEAPSHGKIPLLQKLLSQHRPASCVVFCNTKKDYQAVYNALDVAGQNALSLHGDLEQRDRDQILVYLTSGSAHTLVTTDMAARGLDIKSPELVVNFELTWDPEVHVHRVGHTVRVGNSGLAISFCAPEETQRANILSEMLQLKLNWLTTPANDSALPLKAETATLCINGGKKAEMRLGDILGALTGDIGLDSANTGRIAVHPAHVHVAVCQAVAHKVQKQLQNDKIKGKTCRVKLSK